MRLGFWNRLALVVAAISVFALPTYFVLSHNSDHAKVMASGYDTCINKAVEQPESVPSLDYCAELWVYPKGGYWGWSVWLESVAWSVPLALVIYALLAGIIWVARWIWAGRQP